MTYCAGWIYGDSVLLIGDSAVTGRSNPTIAQSSFGQAHRRVRGEHVEEGLLKLAPIGPSAAAAYAGDVHLATQILEFLIAHWSVFETNLGGLQDALDATFGPFTEAREVAFLLAWWSDAGPRLAKWESRIGFIDQNCEQSSIGSLGDHHRGWMDAAVASLRQISAPHRDVLPAVTALAQSFGVHDDLIEQNIGGAMFGLAISSSGVAWQTDTAYVLYSKQQALPPDFVTACIRDSGLVVQSSITKLPMALLNSAVPDWRSWLRTWNDRIASERREDHFPVVVFIRKEDRLITVLERVPGRHGPYLRFRFSDISEQLHIEWTQTLDEILDREFVADVPQLPFQLLYLREP